MENPNIKRVGDYRQWDRPANKGGRVAAGLLIIGVGAILLANQMHAIFLPGWVFSWKMLLIVIGLVSGFRHSFRNPGFIVPIIIGGVFLLEDLVPGIRLRNYLWPIIIMVAGLWLIFKPRHTCEKHMKKVRRFGPQGPNFNRAASTNESFPGNESFSKEDFLTGTAVFGGITKNVITKDFKGGDILTFCGGAKYNLTHADVQGEVILNITEFFGGVSLIIPPHWRVRSEVVTIFGGIDDKRGFVEAALESDKVLVLKGTVLCGGIEIKSY
ncbi:LiaF transmembrane domain-containing protein [Rufibacter hautae]|uniref:LiaF transmembrane domain-containing protein n=1 Tax=Rufibacter hautae TaxID=2595005 RepID=A0A5B6TKL7_9BACT|nr:DUF5668 domain-containing protein [Rufibacter hautae]KAA3439925.1 hypothetical protein FOA19_04440 [Rufibacter hautae]